MGNESSTPRYKKVANLKGHTDTVTSLSFSPCCTKLASVSNDKSCIIWDLFVSEEQDTTAKISLKLEEHKDEIRSVRFSPDGTRLVTGSNDNTGIIWDMESNTHNYGKVACCLIGHKESLTSVAYSPDSKKIATGSEDKTAIIWSNYGKQLLKLASHSMAVSSVCFSHDGNILATGSWDETVILFEVNPMPNYNDYGKELIKLNLGNPLTTICFNNNSTRIATGCEDKNVVIWDTDFSLKKNPSKSDTQKVGKTTSLGDKIGVYSSHAKVITCVTFSKDGSRLATASEDKTTIIWNVDPSISSEESHQRKLILKDHHKGVTSVDFNNNKKLMASGSHDQEIILYQEKPPKDPNEIANE